MTYIDTSILVSYYCPDPTSQLVEDIILKIKRPAISQLTEVELVSAISRKIREKNLSRSDGNRIISQFQSHIEKRLFRWIPMENKHYQTAKNWIAQFNTPLRTLDALHAAVARSSNLTLLTADTQLARSARLFGLDVSTISDKAISP